MDPKLKTMVVLPEKTGYHVMIVAWIVAESAMAFYQTFDLDFSGSTEPGPSAEITPHEREVTKGEPASFSVIAQGTAPFTYLWNVPPGLTLHHGGANGSSVMYATSSVSGSQNFDITCVVTDSNGKSTTARARLAVEDTTSPEPGPVVSIMPAQLTVDKGESASFHIMQESGATPFTYLWTLPPGLDSDDHYLDRYNVTINTDNVVGTRAFDITCRVTDRNGKSATARARLTVEDDTSPEPGECPPDPAAENYPAWHEGTVYSAPGTRVSYKGFVWSNKNYINPRSPAPDANPEWILESRVALNWMPQRTYEGGSFVNHNGSQWEATYYAGPSAEPGTSGGSMWQRKGAASCTIAFTGQRR